jgi:hypothetical protein
LLTAFPAWAVPVRYQFSGVVGGGTSNIPENPVIFPYEIGSGEAFTGYFEYDTALNTDSNPEESNGRYESALTVFHVQVGAYAFTMSAPDYFAPFVSVSSNRPSGGVDGTYDGFAVAASSLDAGGTHPLPAGHNWLLNILLRSSDLSIFDSAALPVSLPSVTAFDRRNLFVIGVVGPEGEWTNTVGGRITNLQRVDLSVPEPGTLGLLLAGSAGLLLARRRRTTH